MGVRGDGWRYVGVVLVAIIVAQIAYLALTWDRDDPSTVAVDDPQTSSPTPSADPGSKSPDAEPPSPVAAGVPKVKDQRRVDFTTGDDLPDGGRLVDSGDNETGLARGEGGLTHGGPGESGGSGYLETKLKSDVASLGMRVRFPEVDPGSVSLVAWQTSLAASVAEDADPPDTGMRLVASPGEWQLSVTDGGQEEVIATGTYDAPAEETATFQVVRVEDTLYVVDPTGTVTQATSPLASELAGPWASWGLIEASADENPAVIESVWAG